MSGFPQGQHVPRCFRRRLIKTRNSTPAFNIMFALMTSRMYFGKGFLFLMLLGIFVALPLPHVSTVFAFGVDDAVASLGNATIGGLLNVIGSILFSLGGWLVALGGWLFDASVSFALDSSHFQSQGIKAGWAVFRDLAKIGRASCRERV